MSIYKAQAHVSYVIQLLPSGRYYVSHRDRRLATAWCLAGAKQFLHHEWPEAAKARKFLTLRKQKFVIREVVTRDLNINTNRVRSFSEVYHEICNEA